MPNTFAQTFIPKVWDEALLTSLEPALVFADDCTKEYEGSISKLGDTVHILGINAPTITETKLTSSGSFKNDSTRATALGGVPGTPEGIGGWEQTLLIDTIDSFAYKVEDVDKVQSVKTLMVEASKQAALGLANKIDQNLSAAIAAGATVNSVASGSVDKSASTAVSKSNILGYMDEAIQKLYEANVTPNTEIVATVSPRFFMLLKQAYVDIDKNNSAMIENGHVGRYGNVTIKMSNNVTKATTSSSNDTDIISFRTKRAVAFAKQLTETETLRSPTEFANIVRGLILYGYKIIRPAELVNLKVKY